ncbi:histidine phosphatase family protein [Streptomyces sp. NPDC086554]|uniref:histidine phosphatase family protein n=1 Tax=Streptomyces sp. NPDC086554 TaxID=3154864 RepID=UPI003439FC36
MRHSHTAHNIAGIITGRLDEPLSDEGRDAASRFARARGVLQADIVLSSTRPALSGITDPCRGWTKSKWPPARPK